MCCQLPYIKSCEIDIPRGAFMCHRWHMAARKPDAEVGPLGVWAYDTARLLGVSPAQVAERADVTEVTIRKIEGGSNLKPSKRLVRAMYDYFREIGEREGKPVEPPPGYLGELPVAAPADIATLITAQTEAIKQNTAMLERVLLLLAPNEPDPELVAQARPEWDRAERRTAARRSSSLPRTPEPASRPEDPAGVSRWAEPTE